MRREKSKCSLCPLNGQRCIRPQAPVKEALCGVALIGEAPGKVEEERGSPFEGPSGRILNLALGQTGRLRRNFYITNTIMCRPPDNDIASPEGVDAVSCCKSGLLAEIEALYGRGIRVLVPLGQTALTALGLEGRITKVRGSVYKYRNFFVVPTYHPAFVLRGSGKRNDGDKIDLVATFTSDLVKAVSIADKGWSPPKERFNIEPTLKDLEAFVERNLAEKNLIAVDIETTGLDPHRGAKPVVVGLAESESNAIVVPLLKQQGLPYWHNGDALKAQRLIERLFAGGRLLFQNCFFDVPFLQANGWDVSVSQVAYDTMIVHSLVSPETKHDLGFITSIYGKTPEWKESFKNRKVTILEMDQAEMRTYNARDCVVLHQTIKPMLKQLEELGLTEYYETLTRPLMAPFMQMTTEGVGFDFSRMRAFSALMDKLITEKETELRKAGNIPPYLNLSSSDDLRWYLFHAEPGKFTRLRGTLVKYEKAFKKGPKVVEKLYPGLRFEDIPRAKLPEKVLEHKDVRVLDYVAGNTKAASELKLLESLQSTTLPYTLRSYRGRKTDDGKIQVSAEGLLSYRIALQNRLSALESMKNPPEDEADNISQVLQVLGLLSEYRSLDKLKTAFTSYTPSPDGRIRPHWMMSGTATGRLSCSGPNLAQLPASGQGKEIRRFFIPRPGWSIVVADGENAEVAALAYETLDAPLVATYEQGRNIHDENTRILFGIEPENPMWGPCRKAAKIFQFGGLSYGGGDREIYRKILLEVPDIPLTFAHFKEAKDRWMAAHPAYVQWKARITEEVQAKRLLRNAFGRVRIFLGAPRDIVKEGMNFMIQSLVAEIVNRAMIRIYDRCRAEKAQTKIIMQVYDEIVLEAPDEEVDFARDLIKTELEKPFQVHGIERIIRANVGSGKTYGDAK